jgi:hypothetical protein
LESSFIDEAVETNSKIYQYEIQTTNSCGTRLKTGLVNNMVLKSMAVENEGKSILNWNKYNSIFQGSVQYDVLRKVDGVALAGSFGKLNFLQSETPKELTTDVFESSSGFNQCYRITYSRNGNVESYSNWSCVDFENRLVFPNLITPNGDGKNDVFEIINLALFPNSELLIFNRWGKEIYKTSNYKNDWKGEEGVYFYKFKAGIFEVNGTLTVVSN